MSESETLYEASPAEIVQYLEQEHTAGSLAAGTAMFWSTIKEALLAYDKQTGGKRVKPIPQSW